MLIERESSIINRTDVFIKVDYLESNQVSKPHN